MLENVPTPRSLEHVTCGCDPNVSLCNLRLSDDDGVLDDDAIVSCIACLYLDEQDDYCPNNICNIEWVESTPELEVGDRVRIVTPGSYLLHGRTGTVATVGGDKVRVRYDDYVDGLFGPIYVGEFWRYELEVL